MYFGYDRSGWGGCGKFTSWKCLMQYIERKIVQLIAIT
jgi:hypothetical protein